MFYVTMPNISGDIEELNQRIDIAEDKAKVKVD